MTEFFYAKKFIMFYKSPLDFNYPLYFQLFSLVNKFEISLVRYLTRLLVAISPIFPSMGLPTSFSSSDFLLLFFFFFSSSFPPSKTLPNEFFHTFQMMLSVSDSSSLFFSTGIGLEKYDMFILLYHPYSREKVVSFNLSKMKALDLLVYSSKMKIITRLLPLVQFEQFSSQSVRRWKTRSGNDVRNLFFFRDRV